VKQIGEILGQFPKQESIPTQKTYKYTYSWDEPAYKEPTTEERKESLRQSLNITSWDNTFENLERIKGLEASLAAFMELAIGESTWHMLLCYGTAGCGKTHLCEALSIALAKRNIRCRVDEWSELVRLLKGAMQSELTGAYDRLFKNIRTSSRLIIDDVGSGSTGSNWEWGELEDIINYRYRECLFTVVTTNLNIKDLPDRIVSRFRDGIKSRLILNGAGDYRPKKRLEV